jgi:hypothetical protein
MVIVNGQRNENSIRGPIASAAAEGRSNFGTKEPTERPTSGFFT